MSPAQRFTELARSTARFLAQPAADNVPPTAPPAVQASGQAVPAGGERTRRRAASGSFIGPWREPPKKLTKTEREAERAKVRASLEATKAAVVAGRDEVEPDPDWTQFELIPPDQQELPDRMLRDPIGLPPRHSLYYSAAREN